MATANDTIARGRQEEGYVEQGGPHGNDGNVTKFWQWFRDRTGRNDQGASWCAVFQLWLDDQCGIALPAGWEAFVYCPTWEGFLRRAGRLFTVDQAVVGDYVFFHFPGEANEANHIGRLVAVDRAARTVTTLDGNTSPGSAGSQSNGGGVYVRTRPWSVVRSVGRPQYSAASTSPPPNAPTTIDYLGDNVRSTDFRQIRLDDQGNGYVDVAGVAAPAVVSVVFNGQDPASNHGYDTPPTWDREDIGGHARVNLHGGPPKGLLDFTVWSAG